MSKKKGAPVVITRKDKRLKKGWHLAAFMLTGGASAPVSAAKAATNAAYNARTRELQRQAEATESEAASAHNWSEADHERARRAGEAAMAKLGASRQVLPEGAPRPPSERGWKLASVLPSSGKPDECPRCHRRVGFRGPGNPHTALGRKWCPGTTEFTYEYRHGYLYLIQEPKPLALPDATPLPVGAAPACAEARLAEVTRLHDAGVLTDEEYAAKRAEIIGEL